MKSREAIKEDLLRACRDMKDDPSAQDRVFKRVHEIDLLEERGRNTPPDESNAKFIAKLNYEHDHSDYAEEFGAIAGTALAFLTFVLLTGLVAATFITAGV